MGIFVTHLYPLDLSDSTDHKVTKSQPSDDARSGNSGYVTNRFNVTQSNPEKLNYGADCDTVTQSTGDTDFAVRQPLSAISVF